MCSTTKTAADKLKQAGYIICIASWLLILIDIKVFIFDVFSPGFQYGSSIFGFYLLLLISSFSVPNLLFATAGTRMAKLTDKYTGIYAIFTALLAGLCGFYSVLYLYPGPGEDLALSLLTPALQFLILAYAVRGLFLWRQMKRDGAILAEKEGVMTKPLGLTTDATPFLIIALFIVFTLLKVYYYIAS